jgi:hypothetical protein
MNNKTSTYILPLTNLPLASYECRFTSAFMDVDSIELPNRHFFIQLKGNDYMDYLNYSDVIAAYVTTIDDIECTILAVKVADEFANDFDKACVGLFTEMSYNARERILKFDLNHLNCFEIQDTFTGLPRICDVMLGLTNNNEKLCTKSITTEQL